MLKIAVMGIILCLFSATTRASAGAFYVGGILGVGAAAGNYRALNALINDKHFATVGGNSVLVGGLWGVDYFLCDCLYLAFELNGFYNSYKKRVRSSTTVTGVENHVVDLKNRFLYGANLKWGKELCGLIPYVLVGVEAGRWDMNLSNHSGTANRGIPGNSNNQFAKTLFGTCLGLGLRFDVLPCVKADIQYAYNFFGKVSGALVDSITGVTWAHATRVRQNRVWVSLNYVF